LLKAFAGKTINFPTINSLIEAYFMYFIWEELNKIPKKYRKRKSNKMNELSKKYNCNAKKIYELSMKILDK